MCRRRGHKHLLGSHLSLCDWCGFWVREVRTIAEREDEPPEKELSLSTQHQRRLRLESFGSGSGISAGSGGNAMGKIARIRIRFAIGNLVPSRIRSINSMKLVMIFTIALHDFVRWAAALRASHHVPCLGPWLQFGLPAYNSLLPFERIRCKTANTLCAMYSTLHACSPSHRISEHTLGNSVNCGTSLRT